MRLGEIKQILDKVLNEDKNIILINEPLNGGYTYRIAKYGSIIESLEILSKLAWNQLDYTPIQVIRDNYHIDQQEVQITQDEFNQLNSYISSLNEKIPLFMSILDTMVEKQDEQIINIKLTNKINKLDDLTKINTRLDDILKRYNADGQFEFKGFDKGTNWYVILATGVLSYRFLIAGLDIAQKYFDTRKSYFESEKAKLDLKAALDKEEITDEDLKGYKERRLSSLIKGEVESAIEKIGVGTNSKNELTLKIIQATTKLIKELDEEGTEFHLSLNPPEYAEEYMGSLTIDYSKMPVLNNGEKDEKLKQISQKEVYIKEIIDES